MTGGAHFWNPPARPRQKPEEVFVTRVRNGKEEFSIPGARGARMIHGIASTPTVNSHNYSLASSGCEVKLPVPVLCAHVGQKSPIGSVVFARKSNDQIYVRCTINAGPAGDYAWALIKRGELSALSAASARRGAVLDGIVDGISFYSAWRLEEVSICRKGANPDCSFAIYHGTEP